MVSLTHSTDRSVDKGAELDFELAEDLRSLCREFVQGVIAPGEAMRPLAQIA